jgi:pyruvate dehydrogenase E2 component (dihydrolipoamide acetyltransferase)
MAISVVMPALEMAQETGKVTAWLKREGETVARGEPLLEIETDKAVVEVEALAEGILAGVTAAVGDVVPVGRTIAWLLAPGETVPTVETTIATGRRMDDSRADNPRGVRLQPDVAVQPDASARPAARVSPKARRLASEHGVDLTALRGTGPGGEILAEDVLEAAKARTSTIAAPAVSESGTVGRLMAERTTASWTTVPHFFVERHVEATSLLALRNEQREAIERSHGVKVTLTDFFVATVARVLRQHPRMNATWAQNSVRTNDDINIAVAIATSEGVVAPVIHKADAASLGEIATRRVDLTARSQAHRLQPSDLAGGTFAVSNLGMYDVDAFTAIIVQPQAAILAVGAVADRVVAVDGRPEVRPMVTLTLSTDHRVADGARAAMFMRDLCDVLRHPERLFD